MQISIHQSYFITYFKAAASSTIPVSPFSPLEFQKKKEKKEMDTHNNQQTQIQLIRVLMQHISVKIKCSRPIEYSSSKHSTCSCILSERVGHSDNIGNSLVWQHCCITGPIRGMRWSRFWWESHCIVLLRQNWCDLRVSGSVSLCLLFSYKNAAF